jgi:hypothetical protein
VVAAIAFAWMRGRRSPLAREIAARPALAADALRAAHAAQATLDPQTTREVLKALGTALDVDPGKLRLEDPLAELWDMDPHAGFHQRATFEDGIARRYPRLPTETAPRTIADMIEALQQLPLVR